MCWQEEKIELLKLLERVPTPIKESIEEPSAKVRQSQRPVETYLDRKAECEGATVTQTRRDISRQKSRVRR
jgi:pre-mRNA-splicing helicase BRR2